MQVFCFTAVTVQPRCCLTKAGPNQGFIPWNEKVFENFDTNSFMFSFDVYYKKCCEYQYRRILFLVNKGH